MRAQGSCDLSVSLLVAGQFLQPVRSIGLRRVAALWASVPEAPVDEHGDPLGAKEEVRTAW
jgi:hypothetical protein